ncbi:MAG: hypothetical protein LQ342_004113 [Letrouitia transgressa]|nr:MAG: hypothetical protein LQ342_004113 [Letrouitia transgressa]
MSPQHGLYCAAGPGSARYADGMLVKKMDRKDLYSSAFVQPSLHSGTPYPCRAEDLETRNRPKLETKLPYITGAPCREVVREIEQFLDDSKRLSKSEMAAVERLAEGMRMDKWGADIIIKMFADIDALFFMGRLTNSVSIKWASPRDFTKVYGIGLTHGFTIYEGGKLSHIMLNSLSMIGRADIDPFSFMWMVVLHEMVVRLC